MNFKYIKSVLAIGCLVATTSFSAINATNVRLTEVYTSQVGKDYRLHVVAKGETAYSIARSYGVALADLYTLNPEIEKGMKLGSTLRIPDNNTAVSVTSVSSQPTSARQNASSTYEVKPKETLYSISKQFDVAIEDLVNTNPELRTRALYEGQKLIIPSTNSTNRQAYVAPQQAQQASPFVQHVAQQKETVYGIARQYNTTPEALIDLNPDLRDGLKQGMTVLIPKATIASAPSTNSTQTNGLSTLRDINSLKIGIVMPFLGQSQGQSARFVEYYEGFLLALQEMKAKGFSANVYTFDMGSETGTAKLKSLLETYEMKSLDMIIGGISPEQIAIMSDFAQKEGVKYVVPFPTKKQVIQNNPLIYQINAPTSDLQISIAQAFTSVFTGANVIYVTGGKDEKKDLLSNIENQLSRSVQSIRKVPANQNLAANLSMAIDPTRKNVIIPASGSQQTLDVLLPALNTITTNNQALSISLFGHPEWQTYTNYINDFGKYDTYIYTPFFADENDYRTKQFIENYKQWYNNKSLINTYPRYGMLGYDTGLYLLTAYLNYGRNFENSITSISVPSLQTPFAFRRVNAKGGYLNNGFYLIHYRPNANIDKIEYGR